MKNYIILLILLINSSCKDFNINLFSAGSYPYAEYYTIDLPEKEVINRLTKLKEANPTYKVPKFQWAGKEVELKDGRDSHWYFFYFNFQDRNEIVSFWTRRGENANETTIALTNVSKEDGSNPKTYTINKDTPKKYNSEIKKIFEARILDKIK